MELLKYIQMQELDGGAFRKIRKERQIKATDVVKLASVSTSFLCDVEHGRRFARGETALALIEALRKLSRTK